MTLEQWTAIDDYYEEKYHLTDDPVLDAALAASSAAELPEIAVSPPLGRMLMLLAQMMGARRILEIGTLGGYSTIWLARALPADGHLVTLEYEPHHAEVARANIEQAGFADRVSVRVGLAADSLAQIGAEGHPPFDFIFIDADKPSNPIYFEWSLKLTRPGSIILVDNVIRNGEVIDADSGDESVQGVRQLNEMIQAEPRVTATALQTVGSKGYDGFTLMRVNGE